MLNQIPCTVCLVSIVSATLFVEHVHKFQTFQNIGKYLEIAKRAYNIPVNLSIDELCFENSLAVQNRILEQFEHGLSPSAMNKFLGCSLDYYFRYVLKYADDEEVEELVEHSTFGSVVHEVLEFLYQPFVGGEKPVKANDIQAMLKCYSEEVDQRFRKKFESNVELFERGAMYFADRKSVV